jgi:hypothetical protein
MPYIEPCCIDNQLPSLIRQSRAGFCFFQTSGDVSLEKLLGAVSKMASGVGGHVLILTVPEVDIPMLRTLAYYFRRGWTQALLLLTREVQTALIESELADYLASVHYAADPLIIDGQLAILEVKAQGEADTAQGEAKEAKALIIQGAMLSQPDFSLSLYCAWLGTDPDTIRAALYPAIAKLKTKPLLDRSQQPLVARVLDRKF